jgi:hypothetical protein
MKVNHPRLAVALTAALLSVTACTAAYGHGTPYPVQAAYSGPGHKLADHPSIATNPAGFLGYATAWLEYRLRGDATAATAFTGPRPELLSNANWPGSAVK